MSNKFNILAIDFESYYESGAAYSLKNNKYTMFRYIEDSKFKAHMMGVCMRDGPAGVVPEEDIQYFFNQLDPARTCLVAQNCMFDGYIASFIYNFIPAMYLDTLALSRYVLGNTIPNHRLGTIAEHLGVGEKLEGLAESQGVRDLSAEQYKALAVYCKNDAEVCSAIAEALVKRIDRARVLPVIDWSIRCYTQPCVYIDQSLTSKAQQEEENRLLAAMELTEVDKKLLSSTDKFAAHLESLGVEVPMKQGKNKMIPALAKSDKPFKALQLEHPDPMIRALCEARLEVKSTTVRTRLERYRMAAQRRLPVPVAMQFCGAQQTGRFSGGDKMNWQNMKKGTALREAVHAPEGHLLVACDSSNIEARVLDTLAGAANLIEEYRQGVDPYCALGEKYYGHPITKETHPDERQLMKIVRLALGYGMGKDRFRDTARQWGVSVSEEEAQSLVTFFRSTFIHTTNLWRRATDALWMLVNGQSGYLDPTEMIRVDAKTMSLISPVGFAIKYPELRITTNELGRNEFVYARNNGEVRAYGGSVVENICQHLAGAIINEQITTLAMEHKLRIPFMVHDEIVAVCKQDEAPGVTQCMTEVMSAPPAWWPSIPLAAEAHYGRSYADCK